MQAQGSARGSARCTPPLLLTQAWAVGWALLCQPPPWAPVLLFALCSAGLEFWDQQGQSQVLLLVTSRPPTNLPRNQNERPKERSVFSKSSCQLPPRLDTQLSESWRLAWRLVVTSDTGLRQFRFLYYRSVKSIVSTQIISQVNSSPSTFHPPQLHTCTNLLGRLPPREGSLLWFNTFVLSLGSIAFHSIHLKKRILNFNFSIYMLHETWGNRNARSGEGKHSKKGRLSALPS